MSCGKHHAVDCSEILDRVYFFIDHELDHANAEQIKSHLDECGPCLARSTSSGMVKALVARSCSESAPVELRQRVMFSIRQVQIEINRAPRPRPALGRPNDPTSAGPSPRRRRILCVRALTRCWHSRASLRCFTFRYQPETDTSEG